jgi:hypothetical protein
MYNENERIKWCRKGECVRCVTEMMDGFSSKCLIMR